jgi:hypothetical protein
MMGCPDLALTVPALSAAARAAMSTGMYLSLSPSGPIKWNQNQETSLSQDVSPFSPAYDGRSTVTLGERIRELYLQFLWLPEVRICVRLSCDITNSKT